MDIAQQELIEQLQAEIEAEIEESRKLFLRRVAIIVCVLACLVAIVYQGYIRYYFKHVIVKPTQTTVIPIDILSKPELSLFDTTMTRIAKSDDPMSEYASESAKLVDLFNFNSKEFINFLDKNGNVNYKLLPMGSFSISGRVIAKNSLYSYNMDEFDKIALVDMGLIYGKCSGDADWLDRNYQFTSKKYLNGRVLTTSFKDKKTLENKCKIENYELQHLHIIPVSNNVLGALLKQKIYTPIKINGLLVDVFTKKNHYKGSLNVYDKNSESRSGGACKLILVTSVQVGDKIYK